MKNKVSFQGYIGAYSHATCEKYLPHLEPVPCISFDETIQSVHENKTEYALIPIDNTIAGRVADIHHLIPNSNLYIINEFFLPIHHHLVVPEGVEISDIKEVHSHIHALSQCRSFLKKHNLKAVVHADTAGAVKDVAKWNVKEKAAIGSKLAAKVYGLKSLYENIEDEKHNTTRFLLMTKEPTIPKLGTKVITSFIFNVRNVPAALYKSLGGFATNNMNMSKLESYMIGGKFASTQFYAEIDGHPEERGFKLAMEELSFFSETIKILGTYPADPSRFES